VWKKVGGAYKQRYMVLTVTGRLYLFDYYLTDKEAAHIAHGTFPKSAVKYSEIGSAVTVIGLDTPDADDPRLTVHNGSRGTVVLSSNEAPLKAGHLSVRFIDTSRNPVVHKSMKIENLESTLLPGKKREYTLEGAIVKHERQVTMPPRKGYPAPVFHTFTLDNARGVAGATTVSSFPLKWRTTQKKKSVKKLVLATPSAEDAVAWVDALQAGIDDSATQRSSNDEVDQSLMWRQHRHEACPPIFRGADLPEHVLWQARQIAALPESERAAASTSNTARAGRDLFLSLYTTPAAPTANTPGVEFAECVICFEPLYKKPCSVLWTGRVPSRADVLEWTKGCRSCRHTFHTDCIAKATNCTCPICRVKYDIHRSMPNLQA
jgi:hypothetical protein